MKTTQIITLYIITLLTFLGIDFVWLGLIAKNFYQKHIGHLLGPVNYPAAFSFYLFYCVGIMVLAILPGLKENSIQKTIALAALLGAISYATYDLTNLATLKNWPIIVTIVDIVWGAILTSSVAAISFTVFSKLK